MQKIYTRVSLIILLWFAASSAWSQTIQLTNGGSTTTSGLTGASPVSAFFEYMRYQVVYTAAELNAAGITGPKTVAELGWYVSTAPASALPNYNIRMANTTATNSASHNTSTLTEVYSSASYVPVGGGFDMLSLNGSFVWNGTDNLLVDVCYGAAAYVTPYGEVRTYAATTTNGCRRVRCDGCGSQCANNTNTTNTIKPQVSLTFAPVLPVTLVNFSGYKEGSANQLRWATSSEQHNSGFEVQRSLDGTRYTAIGFVNTLAANSTMPLHYAFTDNNVSGDQQYYRLRQVDLDGRSQISQIILIKGDQPTTFTIDGLFPNPANTLVHLLIAAPTQGQLTVLITDILGRTVIQQDLQVETGSSTLPLDISRLSAGTYLLHLVCSSGCESTAVQLIKK